MPRNGIMRIPVSNADLDNGRFTKISRALKKRWPSPLSLMQAQNAMATFLGYRNLHDLQGRACPSAQFSPGKSFSRAEIRNSVTWQMFRRHGINFFHASDIVAGLHLNDLSIDAATMDAEIERISGKLHMENKWLILDEASQLFNPPLGIQKHLGSSMPTSPDMSSPCFLTNGFFAGRVWNSYWRSFLSITWTIYAKNPNTQTCKTT